MTTIQDGPAVAEETAPAPPEGRPRRRRPGRMVMVTGVLAVAGVAVLALGTLEHHRARHDDGLAAASARDSAMVAASTEIATLNTLDYHDVEVGIAGWLDVTTGTLHDQLAQAGADDKTLLADQQKVTTGKVVGVALTELDADAGTATAIASVEITVQGTTGEPTLKRNRFSADLVRRDGTWKLETLAQVAVDLS